MGVMPFMHDTWSLDEATNPDFLPLEKSECVIKDGMGEVILGTGSGANQMQTRLHFSSDAGSHVHRDMMNLTLTSFGRYDIDDIGYNRGTYRPWVTYTLSHNTVIVDKKDYGAINKGNVTLYDNDEITSLVQVNDNGAVGRPEIFRRTVAQNGIDEKHPYSIDIFEVSGGGKIHDYVLHGARFMEQTAETDLAVTKMEAERPLLEDGEVWQESDNGTSYGIFTNVFEKQNIQSNFYVDFKYKDPYAPINADADNPIYVTDKRVLERWEKSGLTEPNAGLRAHFVVDEADENTTLYIGDTPSLKLEELYPDEPPQTKQTKSVVLRRRSDSEGMSSKFITVLEPYEYSRGIQKVEQLTVADAKNAVALKITMEGREDIVVIALDSGLGEISFTDGEDTYVTDGRYAVISKNTDDSYYHLYGGTMISINGDCVYSDSENTLSGEVLSITSGRDSENTVKVTGTIPDDVAGRYVFVNFAKKTGNDFEKKGDTTIVVRENISFVYLIDRVVQNGDGTSTLYLAEESGIREKVGDNGEKKYHEIFYGWSIFSDEAYYTIY